MNTLQWGPRHDKAVQDFKIKQKKNQTKAVDLTEKLDELNSEPS